MGEGEPFVSDRIEELRKEILAKTRELVTLREAKRDFVPGESPVPYAGRVYDAEEVEAGVASMLDFWLTLGPEGAAMEQELAQFLGVRSCLLVNSGSSANLIAFSALTSYKLKEKRILPGDEVITAAAGFPTTVAPIVQNGCVPVFVDVDPLTSNGRADQLESAYVPGKTKAVFFAHTLGNPFDLDVVKALCRTRRTCGSIEDCCDALGSTYGGQMVGIVRRSFGTLSFYPAHHLTMGEGGCGQYRLNKAEPEDGCAESFRDWGRDCWCPPGKDDTCCKRFCWTKNELGGDLPDGYDHKYIIQPPGLQREAVGPPGSHRSRAVAQTPAVHPGSRGQLEFFTSAIGRT
jgi:CDP-4-dehydro-6-deoxyglucose reductase, E1